MLLSTKSYAKVNLFLYVTEKRSDGYHNIFTLFLPINLADTITLRIAKTFKLRTTSDSLPTNSKNIIMQVDQILRDQYNLIDNFDVELVKRIPIGAGLGGGSSNAATYLKMVNKLSKLGLSYEDMFNIMKNIGSDTVFFLKNTPAVATGRGEILTDFPLKQQIFLLIINPKIHISTKDVYADKNLLLTDIKTVSSIININNYNELTLLMRNDLERPVFIRHPLVKQLVDEVSAFDSTSKALMSGSGSTVFAVYESSAKRDIAYEYFKVRYPEYFIKAAISLTS